MRLVVLADVGAGGGLRVDAEDQEGARRGAGALQLPDGLAGLRVQAELRPERADGGAQPRVELGVQDGAEHGGHDERDDQQDRGHDGEHRGHEARLQGPPAAGARVRGVRGLWTGGRGLAARRGWAGHESFWGALIM